ncbi:MAG: recombinase family protein [Chitinophagaceae bacterium]|nr:recombinase family protein [Chitinophagaceae bacterium]
MQHTKTGICYHRFSHKDQSNGSIERQEMITSHWAKNNGVIIQDTFNDDGYSAKTFDRPDIIKLFKFIKEQKSKIDFLIVSELTRFSRDLGEAITMVKKIQDKHGIKIVSASRNMAYDCKDATSFFMMSIEFTLGNTENLKRESDINGGIYTAKAKEGRFIGSHAPYGYYKTTERIKELKIKEEEACLVRFIFNSFMNDMPIMFIYKEAVKQGFPIKGNSTIQKILTNPIYSGQQLVKPYKEMPGGLFPAKNEPLIDVITWNQVQHKLKAKGKKGISITNEIPLKGVLHCHCGRLLTGAPSRGRWGNYYYYYKCNTASQHNNISAINAHKQMDEMLKYLSLPQYIVDAIKAESEKQLSLQMKETKKELQQIKIEVEQAVQDFDNLELKFIRNELNFDSYNRRRNEFYSNQVYLKARKEQLSKTDNEYLELLYNNLDLLTDMNYVYNAATIEQKQDVLRKVFDNGLYYSEQIYRTPSLMNIFNPNELILREKKLLFVERKREFQMKLPSRGAAGNRTLVQTYSP